MYIYDFRASRNITGNKRVTKRVYDMSLFSQRSR